MHESESVELPAATRRGSSARVARHIRRTNDVIRHYGVRQQGWAGDAFRTLLIGRLHVFHVMEFAAQSQENQDA